MKMKLLSISLLSLFYFTGCGAEKSITEYPLVDPSVVKLSNFKTSIEKKDKGILEINVKDNTIIKEPLYNNVRTIWKKRENYSIYSLFKCVSENIDTEYFVVLNPGISNLEGFSINNMKDFEDYILDTKIRNGFRNNERIFLQENMSYKGKFVLYILPLKEKIDNIPVWKTSELKDFFKNRNL